MKKNIKVIFISIFMMFVNVNAETKDNSEQFTEIIKQVNNNISSELIVCSVYFEISSEAIKRGGKDSLSETYSKFAEQLFVTAMTIMLDSRSEEMAKKVIKSRFEFFTNQMMNEIESDFSNFSILMNQHHENCVDMVKDPAKHIERITKQTEQKFLNQGN